MRNLNHHWLTSHPLRARQGEVKGVRGDAPAREISFVSLVVYGPKVCHSALAMGGLQLLKPGRAVPNSRPIMSSQPNFPQVTLFQSSVYLAKVVYPDEVLLNNS